MRRIWALTNSRAGRRLLTSPGAVLGSIIFATTVVLALMIVSLILIPASTWRHPSVDATYVGFDPNLIYVSTSGPAQARGVVDVTNDEIAMTTFPQSHPTIDLVTTPLSFVATFDVDVVADPPSSTPLRVGIWSPSSRAGYFLTFDRDAGNLVRTEAIVGGSSSQDLVGGAVTASKTMGQFTTGQTYQVTINFDRAGRRISY